MNLLSTLYQRLGNPLEWPSSGKAWLLVLMTALLHTEYLLWSWYVLAMPDRDIFVNASYIENQMPWMLRIVALSWILTGLIPWCGKRFGDSVWYEHLATQYYGLTLCYFGYFTGTLSLATGVVLAGAPVFGFIFFQRAPVLAALGTALVVQAVLSWGSALGHWPYAPTILNLTDGNGSLSPFWLNSMYLFAVPHLVVLASLSYYILQRWRRREEEVRYLSQIDPLTRLPNRRHVLDHLTRELEKGRRHGLPLSVMMVDLDNFKQINDEHGHPAGDKALIQAGEILRDCVRQSDLVGRFGGEEFLVVLAGADLRGTRVFAERCRSRLEGAVLDIDGPSPVHITASFGIFCTEDDPNMDVEELLRLADRALYEAKAAGRNMVITGQRDAGPLEA